MASSPIASAAQALKFVLELAMLAAYAIAFFRLIPGPLLSWVAAIGAPILVGVVWGLLIAPRAPVSLGVPARVVLTAVIFAGAITALALAGRPVAAVVLAVAYVVDEVALIALRAYPAARA